MTKTNEFKALVAIPHSKRTLEQRVRICELAIGKVCTHLTKIDRQNDRNKPALRAAMMRVRLD